MTIDDSERVARDARPPLLLVRILNPAMRLLLRTPVGRFIRPFALIEFHGHRSGRRYRVPVGWHEIDGAHVVFTPAPWRANFRTPSPVTVTFRSRRRDFTGTLDDDPEAVAAALQTLADQRGTLRPIGVAVPSGHRITEADVAAVDRALIRFTHVRTAPAARQSRMPDWGQPRVQAWVERG